MNNATFALQKVQAIWKSVLSVHTVAFEDDFYDKGGNSLTLIELISQICEQLDLAFNYRPFLTRRTFGTLWSAVSAGLAASGSRDQCFSDTVVSAGSGSSTECAIRRAERAAVELLASRPFPPEDHPAQTLALALLMSAADT